ncbi:hypothetical protein Agub_g13429 [Astrephomene gubernaculifera]|uniref:SEC7 domain-containing protein n=1 Tax=Astrephomene gubernaculifera TaxID=47775 RepID=A0AAD3DZT2_9CHLO|nr:hypothetical protein Agub_g13429 [Astrephomene gubernaculifera]
MPNKQAATLLLNHEIASVITAMRHNAKWAMVPRYYEEDRNEPSKYDDAFRALRSEIFTYHDWREVDPMIYLSPFLDLIKASDVSGPITGAAAVALQRILQSDLLAPGTRNVETAINQIVEDATQCKFESTNNSSDEVVLLNIVQVLEQAVGSAAGVFLTDESVCKAVQAAFMLGDPARKPKEYGDIMGYYSRQACGNMIRTVFRHVALQLEAAEERAEKAAEREKAAAGGGAEQQQQQHAGDVPVAAAADGVGGSASESGQAAAAAAASDAGCGCRYGVRAAANILEFLIDLIQKGPALQGATKETVEEMVVFSLNTIHQVLCEAGGALGLAEPLARLVQVDLLYAMCQAVVQHSSVSVITGFCQTLLAVVTYLGHVSMAQTETVMQRVLLRLADGKGVVALEQQEAALEGLLDLVRQPHFVHDMFVNCDCRVERANLFEEVCSLISKTAFPVSKTSVGPLNFISLEALLAVLGALAHSARSGHELLSAPSPANEVPLYVDVWGPLVAGQHPQLERLAEALLAPPGHLHGQPHGGPHGAQQQAAQGRVAGGSSMGGAAAGLGGVLSAAEVAAQAEAEERAAKAAAAAGNGVAGPPSPSPSPAAAACLAAARGVRGVPVSGPLELRCAMAERCLKTRIALAVDHFNKDFKKGLVAMQAAKLLPEMPPPPPPPPAASSDSTPADPEAAAAAAASHAAAVAAHSAAKSAVAARLGQLLFVCPGLNKVTVGELLGDPDPFYLEVLDAYTACFDFAQLKFDTALRMFIESFKLPGEAQKIDRIINAFGRHYYEANSDVFRSADAPYVLAYSVIMLNTDQHNSQVKNKMTLESFQRNLRGVNDGADFDRAFLEEIFYSIVRRPLRLSEPASMEVSEQCFLQLAQTSGTQRGLVLPSEQGRHLFDTTMFRLIWGPAVHAMCAIVDNCTNEALIGSALEGLQLACQIAAAHELEDVADSIIVNLSKIPLQHLAQVPASARSDVAFGRDPKMRAVTRALASIINKHGDCLRGGWTNVMDLLVQLYRRALLPDSFCRALSGDGDGGLVVREGECGSLRVRRWALQRGGSAASGSSSIFRHISSSFTQMLSLASDPDPTTSRGAAAAGAAAAGGPGGGPGAAGGSGGAAGGGAVAAAAAAWEAGNAALSEGERAAVTAAEECLIRCAFEDAFMDSKFLKQESLVQLVRAICSSCGPIPRPPSSSSQLPWDASELCLELLFTVLLRNRDRITLLWPRAYEHFATIFQHSRECDTVLVQKAVMAMMRLCQRLLPYKAADISEPLMRGIQLLSLVDEQVAHDLASTIALEIQSLLQGAAAYIHNQQAWMSICMLVKVIHLDPASFPVCLDTITWVVRESLTVLNYHAVVSTAVDLLERAVPDPRRGERQGHPAHIAQAIRVVQSAEEWLELWWMSSQSRHPPEALERLGLLGFKADTWHLLLGWLCRLAKNTNLEVRTGTMSCLQRTVVAAERLLVPPGGLARSLSELLLPLGQDLVRCMGNRDMPQCDVTVRELVRALSKMVLLYHSQLESLPSFGSVWRGILEVLAAAAAANTAQVARSGGGSGGGGGLSAAAVAAAPTHPAGEVLAEALPEALKNMLLVLHSKGLLVEGWRDAEGGDLWDLTWRLTARIAPGLSLQQLSIGRG